jgi:hypothetical protein
MKPQARIYRPSKSAMQSGKAGTKEWVLEFEPAAAKRADPLMGWAGSTDTREQVRLHFASADEAEACAKRLGLDYTVAAPQSPKLKLKAYADNFRYERAR